jgi:oligoendopeptidase F
MMLSTIETTSNSFHEYIKVKTEMMGLEKLTDFDLYGPLTNEQTWTFTWSEAKKAVIESYYAFDEIAGSVVRNMFRNRRIDAANRSGKNSWAYSWGWPRGQSSFITFTFNGNLHDVYTLAHENGHSVQTHLTYLAQTPFNCLTSSCLSEMGSIFGELLLTDKLLGVAKTDSRYRNLLNHVLGGFYFHVYHISARTFFEQSIYDYVADGGLLDDEAICMLWTKARERIFGDYIEWSRYSEYEWARTPHNFLPLYRFYNYPYSFGQLLVYALYEDYKTHSESFTTRFKKLLSNGSSMKPQDQLFEFGYDISKRSFWKRGIRQADKFLRELKTMT